MSEYFSNAKYVSDILFNCLSGYAILKVVQYFVNKDKNSSAQLCAKWNEGTNILIGHDNSNMSVLKAVVESNDNHMINESTFNKVQRRFTEIKQKSGENETVHLHLRTPGGDLFFAMLIAHTVSDWKGKVIAHIHSYSASGGTLIALACDEIHMDSLSVLGPIDPQMPEKMSQISLTNYLKVVGADIDAIDDLFDSSSLFIAVGADDKECSKVANALSVNLRTVTCVDLIRTYKKFLMRILKRTCKEDDEAAKRIIDFFWIGRDHSSPIWRDECKKAGLNVVFVDE